MIKVKDHWEKVDNLEDISRVIREYYNSEIADIMDNLIDRLDTMSENDIDRLNELEEIIGNVRDLVW